MRRNIPFDQRNVSDQCCRENQYTHLKFNDFSFFENRVIYYRGADKSLARPDWKNNWNIAIFRPKRRSLLR